MNKMTTVVTSKQSLELKNQKTIEHSGIVNLHWQRIDIQVSDSKIIKDGVELFKD